MRSRPTQSENAKENHLPVWLPGVMLVVVTILAYQPVWRAGFIWDDNDHLTREELRSVHGLGLIWGKLGATQQYYPLVHSVFWMEHRLWGDASAPYHWVNILLHACSALLVAKILKRLEVPGAWVAAALFALHPVQVESVAWVSELKNTLSGLFYLSAMLAYLKFHASNLKSLYGLSLLLFVLGLLSKTVVATLPGALLVILWWKRGSLGWRRDVLPLVPFFGAGLGAGLLTAWVEQKFVGAQGTEFHFTAVERCLIAGRDIWFYLGKLCWPADLVFIYPRWDVSQGALWQYAFPVGVLVLLGVLVWRRWWGPLAALLFFAGTLFPALGFVNVYPFRFSFVADHFQYLACLGPLVLAAAALSPGKSYVRPALCGALLLVLGTMTWRQCGIYADAQTLWQRTLQRHPNNWLAHHNLGATFLDQGQTDEAIAHFREAVRLRQDLPHAHFDLGMALERKGQMDEAIEEYREAIRQNLNNWKANSRLGTALEGKGQLDEAISQFRQAIQLNPLEAKARFSLASALARKGQLDEAISQYQEAIRLKPDYVEAHNNLGTIFQHHGWLDEAASQYRLSILLKPDSADAHYNLGLVLKSKGLCEEAIKEYQEAIRLKPDFPMACCDLGLALQSKGRTEEAIKEYQQAIRLAPQYAEARNNLGAVLGAQGRIAEAIGCFQEAVRLKRDYVQARKNLGLALERTGRLDEAITQYQEALRLKPDDTDALNDLNRAAKLKQPSAGR